MPSARSSRPGRWNECDRCGDPAVRQLLREGDDVKEPGLITQFYRIVAPWRGCPPGSVLVLTTQPTALGALTVVTPDSEAVVIGDYYTAVAALATAIAEGSVIAIPVVKPAPIERSAIEILEQSGAGTATIARYRSVRERMRRSDDE